MMLQKLTASVVVCLWLLLCGSLPAGAQAFSPAVASASSRIAALRGSVAGGDRAAVDRFWEEIRSHHSPLIEPMPDRPGFSFVTFVWQGGPETKRVTLRGGPAGFVDLELERLLDTNVWYVTYQIRNDARFTYNFGHNIGPELRPGADSFLASLRADPFNPNRFPLPGINLPLSYVELPDAPQQRWIEPVADGLKGTVQETRLHSDILNNDRTVWVYRPRGFDVKRRQPYPVVIAFDGAAYVTGVPVPTILDNLIEQRLIPPTVAIMVANPEPALREMELACSAPFADFLAKEVVPWMRQHHHATNDPAQTIVGGSSFGGLAALFAGFRHPLVFGRILAQSPSLWWKPESDEEGEWLTHQFVVSRRRPLRIFMNVGVMEINQGVPQLASNRHFRDVLTLKGYAFRYEEYNGGHETLNWRGSFGDGLIYLIGLDRGVSTTGRRTHGH